MKFRLLVIRTPDPGKLADFYSLLNIAFDYHKHETGPWHYAATIGDTVPEIYPLQKGQKITDKSTRLGIELQSFENVLFNLKNEGIVFNVEPGETDFGYLA